MSTWLTAIVINSARMKLRQRLAPTHLVLDKSIGEQDFTLAETVSDKRPGPEETYRKCGNTRSSYLPTPAHFAQNLSITGRPWFEHSGNGPSSRSALRNDKGADGTRTQKTQGVGTGIAQARISTSDEFALSAASLERTHRSAHRCRSKPLSRDHSWNSIEFLQGGHFYANDRGLRLTIIISEATKIRCPGLRTNIITGSCNRPEVSGGIGQPDDKSPHC